MSDAFKISVETAIAVIANYCKLGECSDCAYSVFLPQFGHYVCKFRSLDPCDWKPDEARTNKPRETP